MYYLLINSRAAETIRVYYGGVETYRLTFSNDVTKIIVHPKRFTTYYDYDVAILHLKDPVIESSTVKIIPITEKTPPPGTVTQFTGFGDDRYGEGARSPEVLISTPHTILPLRYCSRINKFYRTGIPERYICARNEERTSSTCEVCLLISTIY